MWLYLAITDMETQINAWKAMYELQEIWKNRVAEDLPKSELGLKDGSLYRYRLLLDLRRRRNNRAITAQPSNTICKIIISFSPVITKAEIYFPQTILLAASDKGQENIIKRLPLAF